MVGEVTVKQNNLSYSPNTVLQKTLTLLRSSPLKGESNPTLSVIDRTQVGIRSFQRRGLSRPREVLLERINNFLQVDHRQPWVRKSFGSKRQTLSRISNLNLRRVTQEQVGMLVRIPSPETWGTCFYRHKK